MSPDLERALFEFAKKNKFLNNKGPLSLALIINDKYVRESGLPINPDELIAESKTQVKGLSGPAIKKILEKHGIHKVLAKEGGRTSRGSRENMRLLISFFNRWSQKEVIDPEEIERFWIERVKEYFANQPFNLNFDASKSTTFIINDLLNQAVSRQKEENFGTQVLGTLIQHLVGAKLELIFPGVITHNQASTADSQLKRQGDFSIGESVIHVTSSPTEALIDKCLLNIRAGLSPVVVTLGSEKKDAGMVLAENKDIKDRVDFFSIQEFLATNIYERGEFKISQKRKLIERIVAKYNELIDDYENDPSLKIAMDS